MGKIGLIIKREYSTRVKKKSFIIMTIIGPILFAALTIGGVYIATLDTKKHDVVVVDKDGLISAVSKEDGELICKYPRNFKDTDKIKYTFKRNTISYEDFKTSPFSAMVDFDAETINAGNAIFLTYKEAPNVSVKGSIKTQLDRSFEEMRVERDLNISYKDYQAVKVGIRFAEQNVEKIGQSENLEVKAVIGFVFSMIIYLFIFMYGVMIMRGVIEEKTNRIVEVIVSSVKPFQLMLGKVIGIGAVALTQFILWVVFGSLFITILMPLIQGGMMDSPAALLENGALVEMTSEGEFAEMANQISDIIFSIPWFLMFTVFIFAFIGGFCLYGAIFAAIGAAVDSETETQQFMLPITIPLIFGFIIAEFMIMNPTGAAGVWGSFIPLTSPVVLMVRTSVEGYSILWQIIVSLLLLWGTALLVIMLAGKIYRTGILMYGKKASIKEMIKWLKFKG